MNTQPTQQQPRPVRPRWELLFLPLAALVLLVLWTRSVAVQPAWSALLDRWQIHDRLRFTELAMFALCLIAVVAIARASRSP
ncbi:MAG TPA: hypothetical protein PKK06_05480 [Phycisphaerae bacterium]|nr:hypothetical protein [Phycisphaerae bacterium]HNU44791.1 hypothetical protein [Phycisphaerae bacterium]